MSRNRCFCEHEVLERLTNAFITHGYAGTSLAVLQEATGLGKQSLYNTFGDKQAMYLQAIDCAAQRYAGCIATMQAAESGRAALTMYFDKMVNSCCATDPVQRNCITANGLLEGIPEQALTGALTRRWQETYELLCALVERGQHDGSIANTAPAADLAELLISLTSGLRVAAQAGRSQVQMQRLVALTMGVLDMA